MLTLTAAMASATLVRTAGLKECTSIFCSSRRNRRTFRQLSGPRFLSNEMNEAPLRVSGVSSG